MNGYNFTERVRMVLARARQEAGRLGHDFVGTEHILLGLVQEGEGLATAVLENLGAHADPIRQRLMESIAPGTSRAVGADIAYTPRGKRTLELAMSEARQLDHSYVGTEHLLLGLLAEGQGLAAHVLGTLGVTREKVRIETLRLLGTTADGGAPPEPALPPSRITEVARRVLAGAHDEAERLGHAMIEPEHILWSLTREREGAAAAVVERLVADRSALERTAAESLATIPVTRADAARLPYSARSTLVLSLAQAEARENGDGRVRSLHLLLGVLRERATGRPAQVEAAGLSVHAVRIEQDRLLG